MRCCGFPCCRGPCCRSADHDQARPLFLARCSSRSVSGGMLAPARSRSASSRASVVALLTDGKLTACSRHTITSLLRLRRLASACCLRRSYSASGNPLSVMVGMMVSRLEWNRNRTIMEPYLCGDGDASRESVRDDRATGLVLCHHNAAGSVILLHSDVSIRCPIAQAHGPDSRADCM